MKGGFLIPEKVPEQGVLKVCLDKLGPNMHGLPLQGRSSTEQPVPRCRSATAATIPELQRYPPTSWVSCCIPAGPPLPTGLTERRTVPRCRSATSHHGDPGC